MSRVEKDRKQYQGWRDRPLLLGLGLAHLGHIRSTSSYTLLNGLLACSQESLSLRTPTDDSRPPQTLITADIRATWAVLPAGVGITNKRVPRPWLKLRRATRRSSIQRIVVSGPATAAHHLSLEESALIRYVKHPVMAS